MSAAVPIWRAALLCRCPRCGKGPLYSGVLTIRDTCRVCGLDLRSNDTGDGATVPVILVLGTILVVMAFWVEFRFSPPLWVHAVIWPVLAVPLALAMMRPIKAGFVALQFRHRASEMNL